MEPPDRAWFGQLHPARGVQPRERAEGVHRRGAVDALDEALQGVVEDLRRKIGG